MRYNQSEKMEIIRLVEESNLPVHRTLKELYVPKSTFYGWYCRFEADGPSGLVDHSSGPQRIWNRIPDSERKKVVNLALELPEKTPRELAFELTDKEGYFISESSVYRILKAFDLITSPAYIVITADNKFKHPSRRVNELWHTDFTYFKIVGWGWYYFSCVMDDYSRYIISWKLFSSMSAIDVQEILDLAISKNGVEQVKVRHRPRLLSDNGPCYLSGELKKYLADKNIDHIRGRPYHPMTQGKIERFHRSMKNVINLEKYYFPWELEKQIWEFVRYYNNERYHESLNNLTPADVYAGRSVKILNKREEIKQKTMQNRRIHNLKNREVENVCN
jgi:transposase InsO family protein